MKTLHAYLITLFELFLCLFGKHQWENMSVTTNLELMKCTKCGTKRFRINWVSNGKNISPDARTLEVGFEDGNRIITTGEHPLLNSENRWIKANDIRVGDDIKCLYNTQTFGHELTYPTHTSYRKNNKVISQYIK